MKVKKDEFALNYGDSHGGKELSAEEIKALKKRV